MVYEMLTSAVKKAGEKARSYDYKGAAKRVGAKAKEADRRMVEAHDQAPFADEPLESGREPATPPIFGETGGGGRGSREHPVMGGGGDRDGDDRRGHPLMGEPHGESDREDEFPLF